MTLQYLNAGGLNTRGYQGARTGPESPVHWKRPAQQGHSHKSQCIGDGKRIINTCIQVKDQFFTGWLNHHIPLCYSGSLIVRQQARSAGYPSKLCLLCHLSNYYIHLYISMDLPVTRQKARPYRQTAGIQGYLPGACGLHSWISGRLFPSRQAP